MVESPSLEVFKRCVDIALEMFHSMAKQVIDEKEWLGRRNKYTRTLHFAKRLKRNQIWMSTKSLVTGKKACRE